ncbi:MFS transporter [Paenibacillus sp. MMO-58]|uniref:MFS transporter n=1 Tax=Paenibacillus sp. MMO-58 TaxID=3081290 RepID=UPI0030169BC1
MHKSGDSLFSIALLLLFTEFLRGAYLVAFLPNLVEERLGIAISVVGIAVSVHYLVDSLCKIYIGYMIDRYGYRAILHLGFLLAAVGMFLIILAKSEMQILLSSALLGIGLSPIWLICMKQVKGENRAKQAGFIYVFWMAGLGLGPVLFNLVLDLGWNYSVLVLILALVVGWLSGAFNHLHNRVESKGASPQSIVPYLKQVTAYIRVNPFILPAIILQTTGAGMVVPFLNVFAANRLSLTHTELSIIMILGGASVTLLLVPMGKWFDASGSRWFLISGFGLFAISLFALTGVDSFYMSLVVVIVMGASYAMLLPAWNALMSRHVPMDASGTGWGLLSTIEGFGVVVGPLIGSFLYVYGSIETPFIVSAVMFGMISIMYFFMPSKVFRYTSQNA